MLSPLVVPLSTLLTNMKHTAYAGDACSDSVE